MNIDDTNGPKMPNVDVDWQAGGWRPIDTAPKDGKVFDAWCVDPKSRSIGVRFTDVMMRGDRTGFGIVVHLPSGVMWEYLEK